MLGHPASRGRWPSRRNAGRLQACMLVACLTALLALRITAFAGSADPAPRTRSQLPQKAQGFSSDDSSSKKKKEMVNVKEAREKAEREAAEAEAKKAAELASETESDRKFRERYLEAENEAEPAYKRLMAEAKTKEDRFKVGLKVGDPATSFGILAQEWLECLTTGDKDRLDKFLEDVGIPGWALTLIQIVVVLVPWALIALAFGWKLPF
eukprot:gb/GFBE01000605.1/.p1 GENE.gb/GFBE01000605.1/~~gb/GFBE01000605.1/.p1  ORF type:complete len:210 (+),score=55.94 gb/GFBE01000605.1/:1-630(+)